MKSALFIFAICYLLFAICPVQAQDLYKAQELFLRGEYQKSVTECERLLSLNPEREPQEEVYYLLGIIYLKEGNFMRCRDIFQIITEEIPKPTFRQEAFQGLADTYFKEGDFKEARGRYEKIIKEFPNCRFQSVVYLRLGEIALKEGRWLDANRIFMKIIKDYRLSFEAEQSRLFLASDNFFTLQAGAFLDEAKAKNLSLKLINQGYKDVYISTLEKDGRVFYRVRVGKLNTRKDAQDLKYRLETAGYKAAIYP
ncbi:MAG: tetratricopeptide repeat protein [Candidatus Omnitrophota bacterium]